MAYVKRDDKGNIIEVFDSPQPDAKEFLPLNSEELITFLSQSRNADAARVALTASDMALIRVLEDLINTLIEKGVILFTDLPPAAQEKLASREKIRDKLNELGNLMGDDQGIL